MSGEQKVINPLTIAIIREREINTKTTSMRGDIVQNRLRGGQEWRKSEAEETVIADSIGNGKD